MPTQDGGVRVWHVPSGLPVIEPLRHQGSIKSAQLSPDGLRVAAVSRDGTARIWEIPEATVPVPEWLLELAESLAGQRLDAERVTYPSFDKLFSVKERIVKNASIDVYSVWARDFFTE